MSAAQRKAKQRKAQKASAIPTKSREIVKKRSGMLCEVKGPNCLGKATELDHIEARGMGGRRGLAKELNNDPSNLRAVCKHCHMERHGEKVA